MLHLISDSKNAPYHWRNELNFTEVQNIQEKCRYIFFSFQLGMVDTLIVTKYIFPIFFSQAMDLWGYKKASSAEELKDLDPLIEYNL